MSYLPPLPADDGSCRIELFGPPQPWTPPTTGDLWGTDQWGLASWAGKRFPDLAAWQDVTPQSVNAQITWGADDAAGVLSVPAAGSWTVRTYDPERLLDPSNYNSYLQPVLRPGGLVRILYYTYVVRVGFIDTIQYDIAEKTGEIRASDGISLMVKAVSPAGRAEAAPPTLRARAAWLLHEAGIEYIRVEPTPVGETDPLVGPAFDDAASVWSQITAIALDALNAVWLSRDGELRFRSFGNPRRSGISIGGDGIPIDTLAVGATLEHTYNIVESLDNAVPKPVMHQAILQDSVDAFGRLTLTRNRPIPQAETWVQDVINDRGGEAPNYGIGTIRIQTPQELQDLILLGMVDEVDLHVWSHGTHIDRTVRVLGGRIEANVDSGWSAGLVTYEPGWLWEPLPPATFSDLEAIADAFIKLDGAGAQQGFNYDYLQVRSSSLSIPDYTDSRDYSLVKFPVIDWTGVTKLLRAVFRMVQQVELGGQDRAIRNYTIERVDAQWDQTTVKWPGPVVGYPITYMDHPIPGQGEWAEFDITNIVKTWMPVSVGGENKLQYGVRIRPAVPDLEDRESMIFSSVEGTQPNWSPRLHLYVER